MKKMNRTFVKTLVFSGTLAVAAMIGTGAAQAADNHEGYKGHEHGMYPHFSHENFDHRTHEEKGEDLAKSYFLKQHSKAKDVYSRFVKAHKHADHGMLEKALHSKAAEHASQKAKQHASEYSAVLAKEAKQKAEEAKRSAFEQAEKMAKKRQEELALKKKKQDEAEKNAGLEKEKTEKALKDAKNDLEKSLEKADQKEAVKSEPVKDIEDQTNQCDHNEKEWAEKKLPAAVPAALKKEQDEAAKFIKEHAKEAVSKDKLKKDNIQKKLNEWKKFKINRALLNKIRSQASAHAKEIAKKHKLVQKIEAALAKKSAVPVKKPVTPIVPVSSKTPAATSTSTASKQSADKVVVETSVVQGTSSAIVNNAQPVNGVAVETQIVK